jgi:TetR/AcrR family transcriptional regulator, cholesterol catabolism regulator
MLVAARDAGELRRDVDTTVIRLFLIGALNWTVEWYNPQRGSLQDLSRQIVGVVFDGILDHSKR